MSRIYKTKRGFTLVEMVIVIAIVVILAEVVGISIHGYITKGKDSSSSISSERVQFQADNAKKNSAFVSFGF